MTISTDQARELRDRVDGALVSDDPALVATVSADSSPRAKKAVQAGDPLAAADLVVRPTSTADVVAVVRWANEHGVAVVARGAGSGVVGSGLPLHGGVVLGMSGLAGIGEVDVGNRLVTVGAGVLGSDLEDAVAPHGLAVGHYPQSFHLSSVGGWVAMRGSGTFSSLYGNIEDRLADLEVVLPTGDVLATRSVPRASEGPDLKQLFVGSEGTLGVITAVTLRLVGRPESRRFDSFGFPSFAAALETARRTLGAGVRPAVLRVYDPVESAAKHARFSEDPGWLMVLAFDGDPRLTRTQQEIVRDLAEAQGATALGAEPGVAWEQRRFDWSWFTDAVEVSGGIAEAIELTTTWSRLPRLYEAVTAAAGTVVPEVMAHVSHVYDQGASLYVISRGFFPDDTRAMTAYDALWTAVMDTALAHDARISHHHGIGTERARWLGAALGPGGLDTLTVVKNALDPRNVLNPGKLAR